VFEGQVAKYDITNVCTVIESAPGALSTLVTRLDVEGAAGFTGDVKHVVLVDHITNVTPVRGTWWDRNVEIVETMRYTSSIIGTPTAP
jgi:hypothetical protein